MKPPKRQIIKTRPQRPYVIARITIVIVLVLALALALVWALHPRAGHTLAPVRWQEGLCAGRMALLRATAEHERS
jgi:hypothetical protein